MCDMQVQAEQRGMDDPLWRVVSYGSEHYSPGRRYSWDNAKRPAGLYAIQLSTAGRIYLEDAMRRHTVSAGHLMIFRYGERSRYGKIHTWEDYSCRWVNICGAGLVEHLDTFRARHGSIISTNDNDLLVGQFRTLVRLADPQLATPATTIAFTIHQLIISLFQHAEHRLYEKQSPVERAIQRIIQNPHGPWSLKSVAAECGCSREHLSRVFVARVGQTPHSFLVAARLERAMELLQNTKLPIAAVAEQSGFSSAHTLARCVRVATGRSPSSIRSGR